MQAYHFHCCAAQARATASTWPPEGAFQTEMLHHRCAVDVSSRHYVAGASRRWDSRVGYSRDTPTPSGVKRGLRSATRSAMTRNVRIASHCDALTLSLHRPDPTHPTTLHGGACGTQTRQGAALRVRSLWEEVTLNAVQAALKGVMTHTHLSRYAHMRIFLCMYVCIYVCMCR